MTKLTYAIVFVSDMARSVAFYQDIIGFPLKHQSPGWSEFATEGCRLALRKSGARRAQSGKIDDITAGHCHPGFFVQDIDAFAAKMNQAGVAVVSPVKLRRFGADGYLARPRWFASVHIRGTVEADLNVSMRLFQFLGKSNGGSSHTKPRRILSASARKRISLAQKERWAKRAANDQAGKMKPKRTMSASARRKIAAAQRARWAKVSAKKAA